MTAGWGAVPLTRRYQVTPPWWHCTACTVLESGTEPEAAGHAQLTGHEVRCYPPAGLVIIRPRLAPKETGVKGDLPHGTRSRYVYGCRCKGPGSCTAANTAYLTPYGRARRAAARTTHEPPAKSPMRRQES
jgi:hypothetical protein